MTVERENAKRAVIVQSEDGWFSVTRSTVPISGVTCSNDFNFVVTYMYESLSAIREENLPDETSVSKKKTCEVPNPNRASVADYSQ